MLDLTKTYRTRDGSRRNIRVRPHPGVSTDCALRDVNEDSSAPNLWCADGRYYMRSAEHPFDLIPEDEPAPASPAPKLFRYEDCPIINGKRIAEDQEGRRYVLLCNDAPGNAPIVGHQIMPLGYDLSAFVGTWCADGKYIQGQDNSRDLRVPPKPKRTVWVNLYASRQAVWHNSQADAELHATRLTRVGGRAYPIEIEEEA